MTAVTAVTVTQQQIEEASRERYARMMREHLALGKLVNKLAQRLGLERRRRREMERNFQTRHLPPMSAVVEAPDISGAFRVDSYREAVSVAAALRLVGHRVRIHTPESKDGRFRALTDMLEPRDDLFSKRSGFESCRMLTRYALQDGPTEG